MTSASAMLHLPDARATGVAPELDLASATRSRVAMALYGDLTYDSRVCREARTLAEAGYDVTIVCLAVQDRPPDLPPAVTIVVLPSSLKAVIPGSPNPFFDAPRGRLAALRGRVVWLTGYARGIRSWGRRAIGAAGPTGVWHAHDLAGLAAIAPNVGHDMPIIYDLHELFLETGTALRLPRLARRGLQAYEAKLIARTSAVITVNEALASVLRRRYQPTSLIAVHNCPDRWEPPAERPRILRDTVGINAEAPVILYHGALSANRGIEQLMAALLRPGLEDAHLVLMGHGERRNEYLRASNEGIWRNRVHVIDPVPPAELIPWVASADIGAMPLQAATLNLRLSTPNKLFECLAAGTPVVASDFPPLRQIIIDDPSGPLGAVCDPSDVEAIARTIRSILDLGPADMVALRARCLLAAQERWNWDREARKLLSVYAKILPRYR